MSWLYLPEQVAGYLQPNGCSDGEPSATLRMENTLPESSRLELGRATSTTRQSGETLEHSTGNPGVDAWILSLRVSRANRSRQVEKKLERMTSGTCGRIPFALLERQGPRGYCWRTPQTCFSSLINEDAHRISSELLLSWPRWGMWDATAAYPLPPLDSTTNGNGCGLLPTPVARDGASFYVCTLKTAQRVMNRKPLRQLHWSQYGVVFHGLKKGWANPRFSELMMGWPIGWTDLQPLEKGRFRQWLGSFGNCSEKGAAP